MLPRKLILWVVVSLFGLIGVIPAYAQSAGAAWTAWLYENQIGRLTQVDSTGTVLSQIQLPAVSGSTFSRSVAISQDGVLVGYTATTGTATYVNVFNLSAFSTVYSMSVSPDVTTSLEFSANALNFSEGNSTFAFSYTEMASTVGWQIMVVDLATANIVTSLTESDTAVESVDSPAFGFLLPVVMSNRNQEVKFMMIPLGTDGMASYDAYTWNTASGSIVANPAYITPDTDTFVPTGEVLSTISDDRFPDSADPTSGYPSNNTLQVFDPLVGERFIVTALQRVYNPRFVQGGERVAVIHYENPPDGSFVQELQVYERGGTLSGIVGGNPSNDITTMLGTLDGFIFTANDSDDAGGMKLYYVETRSASAPYTAVPVWESASGAFGWLAWVSDAAPVSAEAAFPAWGRAEAAASAEPTTPPIAPPASSVLTVGGEATAQTTEGEVLNLRSGPDRTSQRLGTVSNGTIVTLLEGPTSSADGLIWWRVQLPNGTEGWLVEAADGIQTLVPR